MGATIKESATLENDVKKRIGMAASALTRLEKI